MSCHHVIFMCCLDVRILSKLCVFFIYGRMLLFIVSSDYNDFDKFLQLPHGDVIPSQLLKYYTFGNSVHLCT